MLVSTLDVKEGKVDGKPVCKHSILVEGPRVQGIRSCLGYEEGYLKTQSRFDLVKSLAKKKKKKYCP